MSVSCDGAACCTHPGESQAVLKRDGVLTVVCTECHEELGPAPAIVAELVGTTAAPCGEDIPHKWGWL